MRAAPGLGDVDGRDLGAGDVVLREKVTFILVAGHDAARRLDWRADRLDGAYIVQHGASGAWHGRAGVEGGDGLAHDRHGVIRSGRHDHIEVRADNLASHAGLAGVRLVHEHAVPSLAELVDESEGLVGLGDGGLGRLRVLSGGIVAALNLHDAVVGLVVDLLAVRFAAGALGLGLALLVRLGAVPSEVAVLIAIVASGAGWRHRDVAGLGDLLKYFEAALAVRVIRVVARVGAQVVAVLPALAHGGDALLGVLVHGVLGAAVVAVDDALLRLRLVGMRFEAGLLGSAAAVVVAAAVTAAASSSPPCHRGRVLAQRLQGFRQRLAVGLEVADHLVELLDAARVDHELGLGLGDAVLAELRQGLHVQVVERGFVRAQVVLIGVGFGLRERDRQGLLLRRQLVDEVRVPDTAGQADLLLHAQLLGHDERPDPRVQVAVVVAAQADGRFEQRARGRVLQLGTDDGEELVPRDGDLQGKFLVLRVITCDNFRLVPQRRVAVEREELALGVASWLGRVVELVNASLQASDEEAPCYGQLSPHEHDNLGREIDRAVVHERVAREGLVEPHALAVVACEPTPGLASLRYVLPSGWTRKRMRRPEHHGGARVGVVELGRHDVLDHGGSHSRVLGGSVLQPGHRDLRELLELAFPLALRRLSGHQTS